MIGKWRQSLDSGGQAAEVLTDFPKAFYCIDHKLLIAKLNTYGFDNSSLNFIYLYLSERKQGTTVYACLPEMIPILEKLEKGIQSMFDWFSENFLKVNVDKCHLIASSKIPVDIQLSDIKVPYKYPREKIQNKKKGSSESY